MDTNGHTPLCEDYVSFETAKLLKEKGFDIPCDNYYDSSGKTPNESVYGGINIELLDYNADPYVKSGFPKLKTFSAPTQSIVMKWLREKHIVIVCDVKNFYADGSVSSWIYHIWCDDNFEENNSIYFKTYEEACEAAIKYCLENLI